MDTSTIYAWEQFQKMVQRDILSTSTIEAEADKMLQRVATLTMGKKLELARKKGRGGWWNDSCSTNDLKLMLKDHVEKGDMRDVMNISAMIYIRETVGLD